MAAIPLLQGGDPCGPRGNPRHPVPRAVVPRLPHPALKIARQRKNEKIFDTASAPDIKSVSFK